MALSEKIRLFAETLRPEDLKQKNSYKVLQEYGDGQTAITVSMSMYVIEAHRIGSRVLIKATVHRHTEDSPPAEGPYTFVFMVGHQTTPIPDGMRSIKRDNGQEVKDPDRELEKRDPDEDAEFGGDEDMKKQRETPDTNKPRC